MREKGVLWSSASALYSTRERPAGVNKRDKKGGHPMKRYAIWSLVLFVICFYVLGVGQVLAITVTTANDIVNGSDGVVSLREAVNEANSSPGLNTITFSSSLNSQIINLTNGELLITDDLTINGLGKDFLTVNNADEWSGRVFYIDDSDYTSVILVTIEGLTIAGGISRDFSHGGGGIFNTEYVTLNNCTITGNQAVIARGGGIHSTGTLVINNTSVEDNEAAVGGGGIFNDHGTLTITDSTVRDNYSASSEGGGLFNFEGTLTLNNCIVSGNRIGNNGYGGGIRNYGGTVTVIHSRIDNNTVEDFSTSYIYSNGGGISNAGDGDMTLVNSSVNNNTAIPITQGETVLGGGIQNQSTLTLINTTISGNRALSGTNASGYYGGVANAGTLILKNVTVSNNSAGAAIGGIGNEGYLSLANSIIGDNESPYYDDVYNTGSVNLEGTNIIEDGSLTGPNVINADAVLDFLKNNGGLTQTHALLPGSPAIDVGDNTIIPSDSFDIDGDGDTTEPIPFDQRGKGFLRVINQTVDLGAVEFVTITSGQIEVFPDSLVFGDVIVDDVSTLTVTISNLGTADLNVSGIALSIESSLDFAITAGPSAITLNPGANATVDITYSPAEVASDTGSLEITIDDPSMPIVTVSLTGNGISVAEPNIEVTPDSLDFRDVIVGNSSLLTVTISNLGTDDLTGLAITKIGANSSEFIVTDSPDTIVSPGSRTIFTVQFVPASTGDKWATVQIASNDSNKNPFDISVQGVGIPQSQDNNKFYSIDFNGNVVRIDPVNGQIENVGSSGFSRTNSLAIDNSGRLITATSPWPIDKTAASVLVEIDPLTGGGIPIIEVSGLVNRIEAMAFSPSGELFAFSSVSGGDLSGPGGLFKIDTTTGNATFMGEPGEPSFISGLDFAPDGTLYGWCADGYIDGGLYIIDTETGTATDVNLSVSDSSAHILTIGFGLDGNLYGGYENWYRIDIQTGEAEFIGDLVLHGTRGIAIARDGYTPIESCDFDADRDVDGSDLAVFAAGGTTIALEEFATDFGKTNCPVYE